MYNKNISIFTICQSVKIFFLLRSDEKKDRILQQLPDFKAGRVIVSAFIIVPASGLTSTS